MLLQYLPDLELVNQYFWVTRKNVLHPLFPHALQQTHRHHTGIEITPLTLRNVLWIVGDSVGNMSPSEMTKGWYAGQKRHLCWLDISPQQVMHCMAMVIFEIWLLSHKNHLYPGKQPWNSSFFPSKQCRSWNSCKGTSQLRVTPKSCSVFWDAPSGRPSPDAHIEPESP